MRPSPPQEHEDQNPEPKGFPLNERARVHIPMPSERSDKGNQKDFQRLSGRGVTGSVLAVGNFLATFKRPLLV